jgi:multidrug resistance efflux pump
MSRIPSLCPTCNTLCTPQEAEKFKSQQAKIAELENALAAASGTIAAMRADVATDQARIAELEAALEEIGHMGFDMPATLDLTEDAWRRRRTGVMQHIARGALKPKP